ncbi:cache domain-containing protein, partial [bacterium]|nr:cache domain-containing protein [bacterium]
QMMDDRWLKTRNLTEVAFTTANHFAELARRGKMSSGEAQAAALSALRSQRYDGSEYYFIIDHTPKMLMHPFKPEMEGKDMSA